MSRQARARKPSLSPNGAPSTPVPAQPSATLARSPDFGTWLCVVLVFALYSRLPEYLENLLGTSAYFVRIVSVLGLMASFLSGGAKRALSSRPGILLTAFTLWLVASTPFSIWKGGSVETVVVWLKSYVFFLIVPGLIFTLGGAQKTMYSIAFGSLAIGFLSLLIGGVDNDRLQSLGDGTLSNPNYVALFLLAGVPGCVLMVRNAQAPALRATGAAGMLLLTVLTFRTGSRMGVLVAALAFAVLFWTASRVAKIRILAAGAVLGVLALLFSPESVRVRYRVMFSDKVSVQDYVEAGRAAGSSISRLELLKKSLEITVRHPLLGVGPGMFKTETGNEQEAGGFGLGWRETHNTYTQISSEAGLPAAAFFVAALWYCATTSFVWWRRASRDAEYRAFANLAESTFLAVVMFAASAAFASLAYDFFWPILAGQALALQMAGETLAAQASKARAQTAAASSA